MNGRNRTVTFQRDVQRVKGGICGCFLQSTTVSSGKTVLYLKFCHCMSLANHIISGTITAFEGLYMPNIVRKSAVWSEAKACPGAPSVPLHLAERAQGSHGGEDCGSF